jgi:hypothetical protein
MRGSRRYPTPRGKGSCRGPDKLETLIGESGSIGAPPTIVHAVLDALAPFTHGSENLRPTSQKDFCNNIGTTRTCWGGLTTSAVG